MHLNKKLPMQCTCHELLNIRLVSFPGSIGGYMGLLIGGSVLSACEIIDLVITFLLGRFWVKQESSNGVKSNKKETENNGFEPDTMNGVSSEKI